MAPLQSTSLQKSASSQHQHHPRQPPAHHHHHHHLVSTQSSGTSSPVTVTASSEQQQPQHHHHHRVQHHHHHHHSHQASQGHSNHQSPPSSPQQHQAHPRTAAAEDSEMNKTSAPGSPGGAYSQSQQQHQQQVISRTGRGAPPPLAPSSSTSMPASGQPAGRSAINGHPSGSTGQVHYSSSSHNMNGNGVHPSSSSSHHHHHHQQPANASSHLHHPAGAAPSSLSNGGGPPGLGGPITVAEALSNVSTGGPPPPPGPSHSGHPLSSHSAIPPWSSSATAHTGAPMSATRPSSSMAMAGPSSHAAIQAASMGAAAGPGAIMNSNAGPMGGAGSTSTEVQNHSLRWVAEHGNLLNIEASKEVNFSIERRRNLPIILQKLDNETESCYSEIGNIAWNLGDYAKARKNFEIALRRNPYCLDSLHGMARYYHEKANGTNPNSVNGAGGITSNGHGSSNQISSIEDNYTKVVDYTSRAIAIDETGNEGEMWSLIGHAFLQLGQMPRAYTCYQQAIAKAVKKDDPKLWYGIGILYDRYGSVEHAEEAFASVLKLDPNFHKREEVFFRLGIIYKLQGKADASLECFHYILARPPEPLKAVDVWYQIGHAHELKRDLTLAKDAYERVLSTTSDHSKVLQHLGGIYLRESTPFHNPQKCIDYISQSLEHDSTDPFSWYLLGRAFMQQSNYGKAYEAYQQAVYRDGKNPAYWCSIGVLYFNINQYHDALDAYTRAVRIHPFIPEIWQNLGILYESCHDQLADATDAYQRASQLDPGNIELERRLKEVRNALRNGTEITSAPPPPQDIMPDSKSWQSVHMDVSGAKPVYLDSKTISQQPSPASEPGLALSAMVTGQRHQRGTPPPNGTGVHPAAYVPPGESHGVPNGRRRSSFSRPDSSHAHPSYPGQYPDESMRGRLGPAGANPQHLLAGQHGLTMASRPSIHSHASASGPHDIDRESSRGGAAGARMPHGPSGNRGAPYPGSERQSPHALHDPTFRHAISPNNSPRTRAAEYEYQLRAAAGPPADPLYERERQMREAERDREEQMAGSRTGLQAQQQQQQQQRRHGPPGAPTHSPTDQRNPSGYGHREYAGPTPGGGSRRPASPPIGGPSGRYTEDRPTPGRASGSSRPMPGYPYGYYPDGPLGYPDPRRDPRFNNDSRYDYEAAERERIVADRERQARRGGPPPPGSSFAEEDERRRRDMDKQGGPGPARNGSNRRELSPTEVLDGRDSRDMRRGPPPLGQGQHPGPGLPSMRLAAPREGGHHSGPGEQGRHPADPKGTPTDRRKTYGRHPDTLEPHPLRQPEQAYDDETDMANALIGLAGGGPGSESGSGPSGPYRAGEKRPGSPREDPPYKKARGHEDMIL